MIEQCFLHQFHARDRKSLKLVAYGNKILKKIVVNRISSKAPVEAINYIDAEKFNAVIINVLISSAKHGQVSWWLTVLSFFSSFNSICLSSNGCNSSTVSKCMCVICGFI